MKIRPRHFIIMLIGFLVVPTLIGGSMGSYFVQVWEYHNKHWLAYLLFCILSGITISWIPMLLMINPSIYGDDTKSYLQVLLFGGFISGTIGGLIFGIRSLGMVVTFLMTICTLGSIAVILADRNEDKH